MLQSTRIFKLMQDSMEVEDYPAARSYCLLLRQEIVASNNYPSGLSKETVDNYVLSVFKRTKFILF